MNAERATEYAYDKLYRLTEERWKSGSSTLHTLSYTYDLAGQLKTAGDTFANYAYTYNTAGRVTRIDTTQQGLTPTFITRQTFDSYGNRSNLTGEFSNNGNLHFDYDYTYDRLDRLTRIVQANGTGPTPPQDKRVDFSYHADGQFDTIKRYSNLEYEILDVETTYAYDLAGRLTGLTHGVESTTFADYGWTYDAANRITAFTNSQHTSENVTYSYDDAGQLTGADRTGSSNDESYAYDDNGNRITANGSSYTTTANNRLTNDGTFTYTYDDEGNLLTKTRISSASVSDKTVSYTWDYRNRLTSVTFRNNAGAITQKVEYVYDVFDRLIGRKHDSDGNGSVDQTRRFFYDGQHIALATDGNGSVTNRYLHGPAIDMVLADEQVGGELLWTLGDNQGTIRDLVDNSGNVENHRTFNSFGKLTSETNAAVDHLFAYTGRILDEVTGDQNHRARWYDTDTGRWLSEDPISFAAGDANLVRYVNNGPTNFIDPSGLEKEHKKDARPSTKDDHDIGKSRKAREKQRAAEKCAEEAAAKAKAEELAKIKDRNIDDVIKQQQESIEKISKELDDLERLEKIGAESKKNVQKVRDAAGRQMDELERLRQLKRGGLTSIKGGFVNLRVLGPIVTLGFVIWDVADAVRYPYPDDVECVIGPSADKFMSGVIVNAPIIGHINQWGYNNYVERQKAREEERRNYVDTEIHDPPRPTPIIRIEPYRGR